MDLLYLLVKKFHFKVSTFDYKNKLLFIESLFLLYRVFNNKCDRVTHQFQANFFQNGYNQCIKPYINS